VDIDHEAVVVVVVVGVVVEVDNQLQRWENK
jgi:hypothetical protein